MQLGLRCSMGRSRPLSLWGGAPGAGGGTGAAGPGGGTGTAGTTGGGAWRLRRLDLVSSAMQNGLYCMQDGCSFYCKAVKVPDFCCESREKDQKLLL